MMTGHVVSTEPGPNAGMSRYEKLQIKALNKASRVKTKLTTRKGWVGTFDYKTLCLPVLPWGNARNNRRPAPFYGLDDDLPIMITLVTGLQHSLAMIGGLVVPPIIISNYLNFEPEMRSYLVSACLISSGILSIIQMSRIHLFKGYYLGTGLITVVGASFANISPAFALFDNWYARGKCPSSISPDGSTIKGSCPDAYGAFLGTMMLCSLWEMGLSFIPAKRLRNIFPPVVTGLAIVLIGTSLIGNSGVLNWGGGTDCHNSTSEFYALCPNVDAPKAAAFASPRMIGLGFVSFMTIILVELFGSPFMRNASIVLGLLVGCIVAASTGYITSAAIDSSPAITFLWVHTFKLSLAPTVILPGIAIYTILAVEATGDITASAEASRQSVEGREFDSRIQGGLAADGLNGLLSGLGTMLPVSIFAQNNGVISLTKCANRGAGFTCAGLLILYGILGKLSGVFLSIPNPVLGGTTTFLFAQVVTSGYKVLARLRWSRRERFTLAASVAIGLGNILVPDFLTHLFDSVDTDNEALRGFLDSIQIVISTPYLSAFLVGVILWNILPEELDVEPTTHTITEDGRDPLEACECQDEVAKPESGGGDRDNTRGRFDKPEDDGVKTTIQPVLD